MANTKKQIDTLWETMRDALDKERKFISPRLQKCLSERYTAKSTNEAGGCWTGWCPQPKQKSLREDGGVATPRQGRDGRWYVYDEYGTIISGPHKNKLEAESVAKQVVKVFQWAEKNKKMTLPRPVKTNKVSNSRKEESHVTAGAC